MRQAEEQTIERNFSTKTCTRKHTAVSTHDLVIIYFFELLQMEDGETTFQGLQHTQTPWISGMMNDKAAA